MIPTKFFGRQYILLRMFGSRRGDGGCYHGMTRKFGLLITMFILVTITLGYAALHRGQSSKVRFMKMNKPTGILEDQTTMDDDRSKMKFHILNGPRQKSILDSNVLSPVEKNDHVNRDSGDIPQLHGADSTSVEKVRNRSSTNERRKPFLETESDNSEPKLPVHLRSQSDDEQKRNDESEKLNLVDASADQKVSVTTQRPGSDQSKLEVNENACPSKYALQDDNDEWFRTNIGQISGKLESVENDNEELLILTPISNVKKHLERYFQNICSLTFPHKRISIALGEDSSSDQSFELAQRIAKDLSPYFKRINVFKLNGMSSRPAAASTNNRHNLAWQSNRRRHLAVARNQLLFAALRSEKWVLWLDSDIRHIPRDLVERLLWPQKPIVVVNCLYRRGGGGATDTYDRNTWRDTETSRKYLAGQKKDFLMLEGYGPTKRKFLNNLKEEGDIVKLDGVGGSVLLIEGDVHRKGLVFPAFIFDHHLETEGLAKMAARLNVEMFGLPSVNVIHW